MVRLDLKRNCNDSKKYVRSVKVKVIDKYAALIDGYNHCLLIWQQ